MTDRDPAPIDDLARRITPYPVPEGPFDAARAGPEVLLRYGVPPLPDPKAQPSLRRAWERVFGHPLQLQPFTFVRGLAGQSQFRLLPRRLEAAPAVQTRFEGSSNWSGAYVSANRSRRFVQVWGLWTVPDALKVPPPPMQGDPGKDYRVSCWIGLDGQRRYFDASLPQMGTTAILQPDGTKRAEAWVQWFARDEVGLKLLVLPLPVTPGQTVACVVTVIGPQQVGCIIVNLSTLTAMALSFTPPFANLPGGGMAKPRVSGATAEWIVERSRDPNLQRYDNFPDYGQARFELCLAVEGDSPNLASVLTGLPMDLQGARDIRMFETLTGPARTQYISMPHKVDNGTLRVRYGGFR